MSFAAKGLVGLLGSSVPPARRLGVLDAFRGLALLALVLHTLLVALAERGMVDIDPEAAAWRGFRAGVAVAFLVIAGFSTSLATNARVDWQAYLRRLSLIAAAAALVSLVTLVATPERFIFFGILHLLAVAGLLVLPLLRLPALPIAGLALLSLLLPALLALPQFDQPLFWWLGLGTGEPASIEYFPIFPWMGFLLLGLAAGRALLGNPGAREALQRLLGQGGTVRPLAWIGRHTLALYLLQTPAIILGFRLWLALFGSGAETPLPPEAYLAACRQAAVADGIEGRQAEDFCACNLESYMREGLWHAIAEGAVSAAMRTRIDELARICLALTETR